MSHFIYVPFSREEASAGLKKTIDQWIKAFNAMDSNCEQDLVIAYRGEKMLGNLPKKARISVLMYRKPQDPLPSHPMRNANEPSGHPRLVDGKNSQFASEVADHMINDGLWQSINLNKLRIELFFYDTEKNAKVVAKAFNDSLTKDRMYINVDLRIDLHPLTYKYPNTETDPGEKKGSASDNRQSICNRLNSRPILTIEQTKTAIAQYNAYKSSRVCGLSGLLGLNGLFSSRESLFHIRGLQNDTLSNQARYELAKKFLDENPNNYFAQCLGPQVAHATTVYNQYWENEDVEDAGNNLNYPNRF